MLCPSQPWWELIKRKKERKKGEDPDEIMYVMLVIILNLGQNMEIITEQSAHHVHMVVLLLVKV